jgi:hypothetical protein
MNPNKSGENSGTERDFEFEKMTSEWHLYDKREVKTKRILLVRANKP